ncbi:MAG: protein kinase [Planctomycetota bacterium]|nr:protein kinase [Planctomycetota bacterium]
MGRILHPISEASTADGAGNLTARAEAPPDIDGYELLARLGAGGMGAVWRAVQLSTGRTVALKVMTAWSFASDRTMLRFKREVELTSRLSHPGIARVYDSGLYHGLCYYAMELVDGVPLDQYAAGHALQDGQTLAILRQVCVAAEHAHQRGVVHRDLKPSNILVTDDGRPVIVDFGLAKAMEGSDPLLSVSREGGVVGTPAYMSPEQAGGQAKLMGASSDVYSLGVILYRLLVGQFPHDMGGTHAQVLRRIVDEEPTPPRRVRPRLHRDLEAVLLKALARDPSRRYPSAGGLGDDLARHLEGEPIEARRQSVIHVVSRRLVKHRVALAMAGLLLLVGVARLPMTLNLGLTALVATVVGYAYARVMRDRNRAIQSRGEAERQRARVEQELRHVAEAQQATERQRRMAVEHAGRADRESHRAQAESETSRRALYFNRIALAEAKSRDNWVNDPRLLNACPEDLRHWEWHYLRRITKQWVREMNPNSKGVRCVAFSPDGQRLASASGDQVTIWFPATGVKLVEYVADGAPALTLSFSPDGKLVASGHKDGSVRLWNAAKPSPGRLLAGHKGPVHAVAWCDDGATIASAGADGAVRLWNAESLACLTVLTTGETEVHGLAVAPGSARIAAACHDGMVRIWDRRNGEEIARLAGHQAPVRCVAFSPDGRRLASGSGDCRVTTADSSLRIWNVEAGREIMLLRGHQRCVNAVVFSPDGRQLASAGWEEILLWDADRGAVQSVLREHVHEVYSVAFSPDGGHLASGSQDLKILLWPIGHGRDAVILRGESGGIRAMALGPDEVTLVTAVDDGTLQWWDTHRQELVRTVSAHVGAVNAVAFIGEGNQLVSGGEDGAVRIWDARTGEPVHRVDGRGGAVRCVAASDDGRWLASGHADGTVCVWDLAADRSERRWRAHAEVVHAMAFRPGSHSLATASEDHSVRLWDAATGAPLQTLAGHGFEVLSLAFSRDGRQLVSGGYKEVFTWDLDTGRPLLQLVGQKYSIRAVAFSPDQQRLLSVGDDHQVKVWDAATGAEILSLRGHTGSVVAALFNPAGTTVLSASHDGTVRLWSAVGPERRTILEAEWQEAFEPGRWVGVKASMPSEPFLDTRWLRWETAGTSWSADPVLSQTTTAPEGRVAWRGNLRCDGEPLPLPLPYFRRSAQSGPERKGDFRLPPYRTLIVPRLDFLPTIDGHAKPEIMSRLARGQSLVSGLGEGPAPHPTDFHAALCLGRYLYLCVVCHEPAMDRLALLPQKVGGEIWRGECVEVFVQGATSGDFDQYALSLLGSQFHTRHGRGVGPAQGAGPCHAATRLGEDDWTAELLVDVACPDRSLGIGDPLRFNFFRYHAVHNRHSQWSYTYGQGNRNSSHFGTLWMGAPHGFSVPEIPALQPHAAAKEGDS